MSFSLAGLFGAARTKIIATLIIVSLVLGIAIEGISLVTSYYTMIVKKLEYKMALSALRSGEGLVTILPESPVTGSRLPEVRQKLKGFYPDVPDEQLEKRAQNVCIHKYGADACKVEKP